MGNDDLALNILREANEGHRIVAVLKTGATVTNSRLAECDHYMALVAESDHIRLLSYPMHPGTKKRLDISWVPLALAKHVVGVGHQNDPMRYRFLDHMRSSVALEDPSTVAAKLIEGATKRLSTKRLQGDYVHSMSAYVEDMWGELARGNDRAAWVVAREVASGALGMLLDERDTTITARDTFAGEAGKFGPEFERRFRALTSVPANSDALVERLIRVVAERPDMPYKEETRVGQVEARLLEEVRTLALDLTKRMGDKVLAVGATGSIGRNSATEGADYDVHVLVEAKHPDDKMRIDFRLYVPTYPGLPRRAELGLTPTTFLDELLRIGVTAPFSYYHLDHVRHTAMVYDPTGRGKHYFDEVWKIRPPEGFVENALKRIADVVPKTADLPAESRGNILEYLGDECARLMMMRYGLGFVKPKYRSINLDKVRGREPDFFSSYDRLKGLEGMTHERARDAVVQATELFEMALESMGIDYRYRCEEMQLA